MSSATTAEARVAIKPVEMVAPAGTPAALVAAIDAGADTVYCGFRDATNARNYPGLNFTPRGPEGRHRLRPRPRPQGQRGDQHLCLGRQHQAVAPGDRHRRGARRRRGHPGRYRHAGIRRAPTHPKLRRHLSVQGGASEAAAIEFYHEFFGISRVILPRMFTLAEIADLKARVPVEIECFIFGSLSPMTEGRCSHVGLCHRPLAQPLAASARPPSSCAMRTEDGELVCRLGDFVVNSFGCARIGRLSDHLQGPLHRRRRRPGLRLRRAGVPERRRIHRRCCARPASAPSRSRAASAAASTSPRWSPPSAS